MAENETGSPDRIAGAPHPRETSRIFGQASAEAAFLDAFGAGRLHHAWLLTGPRGVGKATLAWRIARFLLASPDVGGADMFGAPDVPHTLDVSGDHPVARRIAAGAEPGLQLITRSVNEKTNRLRDQIVVDDVRRLSGFFQLSATEGGRRVVIIDAADELNVNAANALLKILEEPPARATLLLVTHQPSRLLPTIRSRCRSLKLSPLSAPDMSAALEQAGTHVEAPEALAELSAGSVGAAVRLVELDGLALYQEIIQILEPLPRLDRARALALAEQLSARGCEERLDLFFDLLNVALTRLARTGATGQVPDNEAAPNESTVFASLAPHVNAARNWATTAQSALDRARHGRAVNLDPGALVLDTLFKLQETANS